MNKYIISCDVNRNSEIPHFNGFVILHTTDNVTYTRIGMWYQSIEDAYYAIQESEGDKEYTITYNI